MYLIISERKALTFYRSTDAIQFVSGFLRLPVEEIQSRLDERSVVRFVIEGITHIVVDVCKCSFDYSVDSNTLHNQQEEPPKPLEDYIEE